MQIVLAAHSLAGVGGSETYVVTVADHLQRLGHDVWLHSSQHGRSTAAAQRLGLRVTATDDELPQDPDVLVVQDGIVACELARRYPRTAQVFVAHSDIFDLQLPPQLPGLVTTVVVLYDRVERRIGALAQPTEIVRLTQPVDIERYKPAQPLRERARVAMTLGNYVRGERLELLRRGCERAGIELRHVGQYGEGERPAEIVLNDADIVFGKARVIHEAMACGRAAYVFDHNGGDGWVTAASYEQLAPDNFGGQSLPDAIDEDRLVADLAAYDAAMGTVNRDLIVAHHSATKHAAQLAEILRAAAAAPRAVPVDAPLAELARLVRLYHRADSAAFALRAETERLAARAQALESELGRSVAEAERQHARAQAAEAELGRRVAEAERQHARAQQTELALDARVHALEGELARSHEDAAARATQSERLAQQLREFTATRRWRTLQAVLGPADRLRLARATRGAVAPAPFIVGVARSGTTLLRMQLDSHPQLAIPAETGFGLVAPALAAADAGPELLKTLVAMHTWPDLDLTAAAAAAALARVEPWSPGAGLRAIYAATAAAEGKPRWGDKTPLHLCCMPAMRAALLPEARFIHIIRDGRDVAASVRGLPFAVGDGSIEAIATDWRDRIVAGRRAGAELAYYREIRYERLVTEPEAVLREVCAFVELDFDTAMLRAHERARQRLAQLPEVRRDGERTVTRAERLELHSRLLSPPDPSRAGRWRELLSAGEVARFEATAGDLLAELGYTTGAAARG